jgi:hypothetical protein
VQLRRVLLLFALVLGLSAVVAALAPPPEQDDEERPAEPRVETAAPAPAPAPPNELTIDIPPEGARNDTPVARRARAGSRVALTVRVPEPGDVVIEGVGLRRSADPLAPARFDLLARPAGRFAVSFEPVEGEGRIVARLIFEAVATVRPPRPGR